MATMTQPTPGMRVKKTTFTEVVPTEDRAPSDAKPSPFYDRDWEIVVQALTKDDWLGHKLRVYRAGEKWERGSAPVDNIFKAPFTEDDLRARFGGGKYVLWLYGPPKEQNLVGKYQVELDGAPIINSVPRNGNGAANGSESVAIEAMRMYANPEFVRMQMQMMVTAATEAMGLIKSQMPVAQDPLQTLRNAKEILGIGGPNPMDEVNRMLLTAMVQKLINPPETNSLDATLSLVEKIKNSGIFPGAAKADLASTFVSQIPMLLDRAVQGLHEYRLQSETQERTIRLQRGEIKPGDPNVITVQPGQESAAPAATAAPTASGAASTSSSPGGPVPGTPEYAQAIIVQSHLHRLVMGIKNPKSTGEDMYDYIVNAWPEILDELARFSKEQLLAFFKSRETQIQYFGTDMLMQVAEEPRLPGIIEEFLKIAKENAELEKVSTPQSGVV